MIKGLDHVAMAVKNTEEVAKIFADIFGLKAVHTEITEDKQFKITMIPLGNSELELVEPLNPESSVAKFLEAKGEGVHHICLEVDDVDKELKALEGRGAQLIDQKGRRGVAGKVGFLHPRTARGVLIELAQKV